MVVSVAYLAMAQKKKYTMKSRKKIKFIAS